MHPRRLPLLLLTALFAAGCGPGLKDRLVGKWSHVERPPSGGKLEVRYEFQADGSVTRDVNAFGLSPPKESSVGTYRVVDADTIELDFDGRKEWYKAAVSRDALTLMDATGQQTEFDRVD
jgi:hypothetical protein